MQGREKNRVVMLVLFWGFVAALGGYLFTLVDRVEENRLSCLYEEVTSAQVSPPLPSAWQGASQRIYSRSHAGQTRYVAILATTKNTLAQLTETLTKVPCAHPEFVDACAEQAEDYQEWINSSSEMSCFSTANRDLASDKAPPWVLYTHAQDPNHSLAIYWQDD